VVLQHQQQLGGVAVAGGGEMVVEVAPSAPTATLATVDLQGTLPGYRQDMDTEAGAMGQLGKWATVLTCNIIK